MSDGASAEKTEQPTQKKLRDARKKGQVAKSKDIVSTALVIGLCTYFGSAWQDNLQKLQDLVTLAPQYYTAPIHQAINQIIWASASTCFMMSLPFAIIAMGIAICANYIQIGPVFAPESIKPDIKKLDPIQGFKKIFSVKNFIEFIKSTIKMLVISVVLYLVVEQNIDPLLKVPSMGLQGLLTFFAPLMQQLMNYVFASYIALSVFDYFFQKKEFIKEQRMTKDEVKREYKEMEGSPEIKSKRKQLHQEMLQNETMQNTRKSSVLITNPTHYAVAILYETGKTALPIVTAKGQGMIALKMIEAAKDSGVPILQDIPLAQALYNEVSLQTYVPSDLMRPVAAVIMEVNRMKNEGII